MLGNARISFCLQSGNYVFVKDAIDQAFVDPGAHVEREVGDLGVVCRAGLDLQLGIY